MVGDSPWQQVEDGEGYAYFWNVMTRETTYTNPDDMVQPPEEESDVSNEKRDESRPRIEIDM
jgi:hypothetical protein